MCFFPAARPDDLFLYHFFDRRSGAFRNLSDISQSEAEEILKGIKKNRPQSQCALRDEKYVEHRHNCERMIRNEFIKKNGRIERTAPHYMTFGYSPWLWSWFEQPACIRIPVEEFDMSTVSFTYGDSMPTFSDRVTDGREYRKKLYTYDEMIRLVERYGYPQRWNDDGHFGPERYIEACVWSDETVGRYIGRSTEELSSMNVLFEK